MKKKMLARHSTRYTLSTTHTPSVLHSPQNGKVHKVENVVETKVKAVCLFSNLFWKKKYKACKVSDSTCRKTVGGDVCIGYPLSRDRIIDSWKLCLIKFCLPVHCRCSRREALMGPEPSLTGNSIQYIYLETMSEHDWLLCTGTFKSKLSQAMDLDPAAPEISQDACVALVLLGCFY